MIYYSSEKRLYTKKQEYEILRAQLELERSSFLTHWKELADFILPRRPRFFVTDANRGEKKGQKIIDTTATLAVRTLRSGMMGGVTSPARPWFRLTTPDPDLAEYGAVKEWLHDVSQRMYTVFLRSNLYNALPTIYGDMGCFGTAALFIDDDLDQVIQAYPLPIGSYSIANDAKLRVTVCFREFRMTVRQLVEMFKTKDGNWSNFSQNVKSLYDTGKYESWIDVVHVVKPNPEYDPNKMTSEHKKFLSCYYERGSSYSLMNTLQDDVVLREKGYDYFPVLCPRWEVAGEDVYGTDCPGMTALADVKQLQVGEKRSLQAIEKMVNPPMVGPTSLQNSKTSILPGDITYLDLSTGQQGFTPAHEVRFDVTALEGKQAQVRQRISRAFYEDLFLMLAQSDRREITAREIEERHEEKLLALGPVLEQLNQDLLDPLIDLGFNTMGRMGLLPPPPEEIQGMDLKVEYLSIMAQAQKAIGIGTLERFAGFVGGIAPANPNVLDKIDLDQMIDVYGDAMSLPPSIVRTDEVVAEIRSQRSQQIQQQQASIAMQEGAKTVKDLSQAKLEDKNALSELLRTAQAGAVV